MPDGKTIFGLFVDDKILNFAIQNDLIIFGLEAAKYTTVDQLRKGINLILRKQKLMRRACQN